MSEQAFGTKKIEVKGSGTPAITSSTNLNLTATNVVTSSNLTVGGQLYLGDNDQIRLGDSGDLIISHTYPDHNAVIRNTNGQGDFIIETVDGSTIELRRANSTEKMGVFTPNGGAELYYDNSKKFETTSAGATVTGDLSFTGDLYQNGILFSNSGSGTGLQSRTTASGTTIALSTGGSDNIEIAVAKTYVLHKIQTSVAAWVTLYTSDAARTADASRAETTDPQPGSGVIAEVITSSGATQPITPGTIGWNDEATPNTNVYLKVVSKYGSVASITVTLYYVALEA